MYVRKILLSITLMLFIGVVCGFLIYVLNQKSWMNTYLVPKGFSGWIEVVYDQKGFPSLQQDSNGYVIQVPHTGLVRTSSLLPNVKYWTIVVYYVDQNGTRTEVHGEDVRGGGTGGGGVDNSNGSVTKLPDTETLFIGTAEQYRQHPVVDVGPK